MEELTLFTNPQSRGRIAHWMMEEFGEPYTTVWMDYGGTMKSPDYLAINPMGKVPTLRHGTAVVTEAAAICGYLGELRLDKGLAPPVGTPERADYWRWLIFAAGPLEQAVTALALKWEVPEGRNSMVGFGSYADTLKVLEQALSRGPFICGEAFTAADVYVGSSVAWGLHFGTIEKRAVFEDYAGRVQERPAFLRTLQINEAQLKKA